MPATWLTVVAWIAIAVALACAALILVDVRLRGHRQWMSVMESVWPVTALYLGPVAVWGNLRFGRPRSPAWLRSRSGCSAGRH